MPQLPVINAENRIRYYRISEIQLIDLKIAAVDLALDKPCAQQKIDQIVSAVERNRI